MSKKIMISCGPIPAKLDSVKFVTNKFKGGLAFKTAGMLAQDGFDVTVICWDATPIPENILQLCRIETVNDVVDYCEHIKTHVENRDFSAYIMAAAVANLMPSHPWQKKFPSHNYQIGETFNIEFEIAPRAIDIVKAIDSTVTLIGYKLLDASDDELIDAARITQSESRANIIFANHPLTAKSKKIAMTSDGSIIPVDFDEHVRLIERAINAHYYRTEVVAVDETEQIVAAKNVVALLDTTFELYGTVAIPIDIEGYPNAFATTSRGHVGKPVIVLDVDHEKHIVYADAKATLNAPTLSKALPQDRRHLVIHRHMDDPRFHMPEAMCEQYLFPGTVEEADTVSKLLSEKHTDLLLPYHGSIAIREMVPIDWQRYSELYPSRYMGDKPEVAHVIEQAQDIIGKPLKDADTLEVGAGKHATTKYAYDPYVSAENAQMLSWQEILEKPDNYFDFILMRNSIAYLDPDQIKTLAKKAKILIANSFAKSASSMARGNECACVVDNMVEHTLLIDDDSLMLHSFHAYDAKCYEDMGLDTQRYGKNSVLITKGI